MRTGVVREQSLSGGSRTVGHMVRGRDTEQDLLTTLSSTFMLFWLLSTEHTFAFHFLAPSGHDSHEHGPRGLEGPTGVSSMFVGAFERA